MPQDDRDGFLRRNVLALASVLARLRTDPAALGGSAWDRALARVLPVVRLCGVVVLVACVSVARNMAFVWLALMALLAVTAARPASAIKGVVVPALAAAVVAGLANLPAALFFAQVAAPVRMATKTFVTVGLVASLAQGLGAEGIVAALGGLPLPRTVVMTVDLALRDVVLLGESALSLSEALALRSVGRDTQKTASAAGVMGVTFVRAQHMAASRAEAMALRGYGNDVRRTRNAQAGVADLAYLCVVLLFVAACVYLEVALP